MQLVPTVRLELTRVSPLPPQDSVSTNSTTSASNGARILSGRTENGRPVRRFTPIYLLRDGWRRLVRRWRLNIAFGRRHFRRPFGRFRRRHRQFVGRRQGLLLLGGRGGHTVDNAVGQRAIIDQISQGQTHQHEHRRQNPGRSRQKRGRSTGTEDGSGGTRAECGAGIGALSPAATARAQSRQQRRAPE